MSSPANTVRIIPVRVPMREVIYQGRRYRMNDVGDVLELRSYDVPRTSRYRHYGRQYERGSVTVIEYMMVTDEKLAKEVRAVFRAQQESKVS